MAITLGQTDVGAIYLGGTQIYPTGSENQYSFELNNIVPFYQGLNGQPTTIAYLPPSGIIGVCPTGNYLISKGDEVIDNSYLFLNMKAAPTYTKFTTILGELALVFDVNRYGTTEISQRSVLVPVNYGGVTGTMRIIIGANSKNYIAGECTVEINGTQGRTTLPAASRAYPIVVWANVSYEWTSGAHTGEEIIEDPSEFEITITEGGTDDYGNPWIEIYGPDITVSYNDTGRVRTAILMVRVPGTNVYSEIEITQNYI